MAGQGEKVLQNHMNKTRRSAVQFIDVPLHVLADERGVKQLIEVQRCQLPDVMHVAEKRLERVLIRLEGNGPFLPFCRPPVHQRIRCPARESAERGC